MKIVENIQVGEDFATPIVDGDPGVNSRRIKRKVAICEINILLYKI